MENLLFDSYRVFQKEYHDSVIRRFFKLPILALILFFFALASVVGAITGTILGKHDLCLISIGIEIVVGIAIFFYTENYQLKTIDQRLETYYGYCTAVYKWLSETGFVTTQQNMEQLLGRVYQQVDRQENISNKKSDAIRHIVDVLLIPFLLAIFTLWMTGKTEIEDLLAGALTILTSVGLFGMIGYVIYSISSFSRKRKLEQWRCFAQDLQGVLDTQLDDKMITNRTPLLPTDKTCQTLTSSKKSRAENAGKPWTADDDELLCKMFDSGSSRHELCTQFKRSPNSISSRLEKLGKITK